MRYAREIPQSRKHDSAEKMEAMALYVDAQSVFVAITSTYIKIPADNGVLSHIQYARELLDTRVLQWLFWVDTRDMCADGLTKGSISREAIHDIMEGQLNLLKGTQGWTPPKLNLTS